MNLRWAAASVFWKSVLTNIVSLWLFLEMLFLILRTWWACLPGHFLRRWHRASWRCLGASWAYRRPLTEKWATLLRRRGTLSGRMAISFMALNIFLKNFIVNQTNVLNKLTPQREDPVHHCLGTTGPSQLALSFILKWWACVCAELLRRKFAFPTRVPALIVPFSKQGSHGHFPSTATGK